MIFETCCGSADDVMESQRAGANRAELNSALFLGGLTPSLGELETALSHCPDIEIVTMVRPRSGGFSYTDLEFETMVKDARILSQAGASGIVFGFLTPEGRIDKERCLRMLEVIGGKDAVFHRAFDVVPDWKEAIDQLAEMGFRRILTSGQKANAWEGRENIRQMIQYAGNRIEILPGAGIRGHNAADLISYTGCNQVHMSARKTCLDSSVMGNPAICFGNPAAPEEYDYEMIDGKKLGKIIRDISGVFPSY